MTYKLLDAVSIVRGKGFKISSVQLRGGISLDKDYPPIKKQIDSITKMLKIGRVSLILDSKDLLVENSSILVDSVTKVMSLDDDQKKTIYPTLDIAELLDIKEAGKHKIISAEPQIDSYLGDHDKCTVRANGLEW